MAYRDRDYHDPRWSEHSSGRGNVRRRDDQEDGGWEHKKRRRFEENDGYDDRPYRDYYDEDGYDHGHNGAEERRSRADDDWRTRPDAMDDDDSAYYQSKHQGTGKRMVASEASPHVIFLGLDPDFVEADLLHFLQSYGLTVESVTIIRDRITGLSKSFGFAQFPSIQESQKFVEPNFPFINIPPPQSHGASAAQAFEDGNVQLGRRVKIDYSQSAQGGGARGGLRTQNDGTRDIGNAPTPVVLLRGLDPLTSLDSISEAMRSSAGAIGQGAVGMKRIVLIRDKYTQMGVGIAFVEFLDAEHAGKLLAATMSPELHPEGFRILNKPVATSFANPGSFQPLAPHSLRDEACIMGSLAMGGTEGVFAKYWDETTTILEMTFDVSQLSKQKESAAQGDKKKKRKLRQDEAMIPVDINEFMSSAIAPEVKAPTALPTNLKPIILNINKSGSSGMQLKLAAPRAPAQGGLSSVFTVPEPDELEQILDNKPLDKAMTFRKVAPMIASKKVATSINKWNEVSHELRSGPETSFTPAQSQPTMANTQNVAAAPLKQRSFIPVAPTLKDAATAATVAAAAAAADDQADLQYCVLDSFTCYLCSRQLKTLEQLKKHVKGSDLHKKNCANDALKQTALEKVAKARGDQASSAAKPTVYRDRASERRVVHGQPDAPVPEPSSKSFANNNSNSGGGGGGSKKLYDTPVHPPAPPAPPPKEPAKDENNIGNKMLKKMGWSEGTGLGLSGEGRVDPIQTAMYASGAGLGASKGKDITKIADLDYAGLARESARERYGN